MGTLGERIKNLRDGQDLTQDDLAKLLHVNRSTMANWEINRAQPDLETLIEIADYFGVSIDYLATGREQPENDASLNQSKEASVSAEEAEAITLIRKAMSGLSPVQRKKSLLFLKHSIKTARELVEEMTEG